MVEAAHERDVLGRRPGRHAASTPSASARPASTSSSPRATRPAATPARSPPWCSSPRSSTPSAPTPVLAAGGIASGPPDRRGDGARRPGRVVRLGVAHHRGGRDAPGGQGEVPRRHVVATRVRVARRSPASPPVSCARPGPTSGTTRPTRTRCRCRCSGCSSPRPQVPHRRAARGQRAPAPAAGQLLRRPGRRPARRGPPGRQVFDAMVAECDRTLDSVRSGELAAR